MSNDKIRVTGNRAESEVSEVGVKVGMPILKLNHGAGHGKHRGNMTAVIGEAFPSRGKDGNLRRWSRDADPERLHLNEYMGYDNAYELIGAIDAEVADYAAEYAERHGKRMKSDAIFAFSLVCKPPAEWIEALPADERAKFWRDSDEIIAGIMGGKEVDGQFVSNVRASALHRDEQGEHKHYAGMPYTADGRLCAKEVVNIKLFHRFNAEYPEQMRQRGWDIDDCEAYDAAGVAQMSEAEAEEYKRQRIAEKKQKKRGGLSSAEYQRRKEAEAAERLRILQSEAAAAEADKRASEAARAVSEAEAIEIRRKAAEALTEAEKAKSVAVDAQALYGDLFVVLQRHPEAFDDFIARMGNGELVSSKRAELQAALIAANEAAKVEAKPRPQQAEKAAPVPQQVGPKRPQLDAAAQSRIDELRREMEKAASKPVTLDF